MLDPTSRLGKMENFEYGGQTKKREKGPLDKYFINGPPTIAVKLLIRVGLGTDLQFVQVYCFLSQTAGHFFFVFFLLFFLL